MSLAYWPTAAVLALLPVAAIAQQVQAANPADPGASVPAPSYVSVFNTYQAPPEERSTPDTTWRAANEQVTSQDAHAGHGNPMAMPGMSNEAATTSPSDSQPASERNRGSHHH